MSQRKYKPAPKLIIGVKATRRILGSEGDIFTDEEITTLIQDIDLLARAFVKMVQEDRDILHKVDYSRSNTQQ